MTEIIMYYDSYERYNGDGFYPVLKLDPVLKKYNQWDEVKIIFEYKNYCWKQINEESITGLDKDTKTELLNILNKGINKSNIIKNLFDLYL
jgi:hypothetical protein